MNIATEAPEWFLNAIQATGEAHWVEVAGCQIHYQYWPKRDGSGVDSPGVDSPGILFVHGNGAHSHWWDFITPSFLSDYRVAALDLSGAGDSGHRDEYSVQLFAEEVMCVAADAGFDSGSILVGHSFGGSVTRLASSIYTDRVAGLILVDSALSTGSRKRSHPPPGAIQRPSRKRDKPSRSYASLEAACKRFRLRPPQPCNNQYIVKYIAEHSVKRESAGWQWKLDQMMFAKMTASGPTRDPGEMIRQMKCPASIIYGSNSRFFPAAAVANLHSIFAAESIIAIDDAHHHLFLEQPLQFVGSLKHLLRMWDLS